MSWLYFSLLAIISSAIFYVLLAPQLARADKTSKAILVTTALLVPLVSLLMYQQRGASDEVAVVESMRSLNQNVDGSSSNASMEPMKEFQHQLEAITEAKPEKAEYWYLLGSLNTEMEDFAGAVAAYQHALELFPEDINIHARLAEAQFLVDGYRLTEAVRTHIDAVLAKNPTETTVLGILGISAYRAGQFEAAIRFWERSLQALPPMSAAAQSIRASIEQAKMAAGVSDSGATDDMNSVDKQLNGESLFIDLEVSLGESVEAGPGTSVFVFARQFNGQRMPVAVERITAGQLPIKIRLDDSKVMIPGRKLSDFPELELVARLSFSGEPMAQKGDYEKVIGPIRPSEIEGVIAVEISDMVQ